MTRRRYLAGDEILVVRRSHRWFWWPRPYRHITGGWACHWLRIVVLVGRRSDPAAVAAYERSARRDGG